MTQPKPQLIQFGEEQAMLLDSAQEFCKQHSDMHAVRARLYPVDAKAANKQLWQSMSELGWSGLAIPVEYGGSGMGIGAAVTIAEPMGRWLMATPFTTTQMVIAALLAGGSDAQRGEWLPKLAAGKAATVAVVEENGDWQLAAPQAQLVDQVLTGQKTLIGELESCDLVLVSVVHENQLALVLLSVASLDAERISADSVIDETRRSYTLNLDGLRIVPEQVLGGSAAPSALKALEQVAWLLYSAEACGGTSGVIDLVVDYLCTRTQFGHKIGSYQALKHPTVDMLMGLERARSHLYHAATLLDSQSNLSAHPSGGAEIALRMAKAESTEAFAFASDRAIQFHGGFGFTYDCDAQLYLRRSLWLQYQYGDAPHHRAQLAHQLLV